MANILQRGTPAPDFTLPVTPDQKLSLRELKGQPVILAFYPADWSPVCGDQMALYNEVLPEFQKHGARLLGISNVFQAEIAALDPGRNTSRLRVRDFELAGPYYPGRLRGDQVWVCARAEELRAAGPRGRCRPLSRRERADVGKRTVGPVGN